MHNSQRDLRVFISDCEGPISKNDNAFEVASHFIPNGDRLFSIISIYDDIQADIVKRPGYRAGYTLALIIPFLKVHNTSNKKLSEFSAKNILLIHGAKEMLLRIKDSMPSFLISTSYEQYISSICAVTGFPYENVYCTKLDLDKYSIEILEVERLKHFEEKILSFPMIEMSPNYKSLNELPKKSQETVRKLDIIFWEKLPSMVSFTMLKEIKPIGGEEKANSIRDIMKRIKCDISNIMYVGDSITDVQALKLVREGNGLTISFNGNEYAIKNAEVAILSENAFITSMLTDVFFKFGKETVINLIKDWSYNTLHKYYSDKTLIQTIMANCRNKLPKIELVTRDNVDRLSKESSLFRKTVRGEIIGNLG